MVDPVALQLGFETPTALVYWLIAAFAGGAFGAAIGALPAFCFTGFAVIAGEAANSLGLSGAGSGVELGASGITGLVGFGPVFGPHISFAAGAAAAAYAAKQDGAMYEPGDGDYHLGKDIAYALGTRPDVLAVGGAFGIFGALSNNVLATFFPVGIDTIAATVFVSALLHRVVFGYSVIGKPRGDGYFDMTPFENEEMRTAADGGEVATDGGAAQRLAVEPWLPHQYTWGNVAMIGLVAGLLGGFLVITTGSMFLGFGISAASLTFLNLGVEKIPVTHHMTLPASAGAAAFVAEPTGSAQIVAILIAAAFGIAGALIGEAGQRVFYAHGDTHVDPPAFAIAVCTLFIGIMSFLGLTQRGLFVAF